MAGGKRVKNKLTDILLMNFLGLQNRSPPGIIEDNPLDRHCRKKFGQLSTARAWGRRGGGRPGALPGDSRRKSAMAISRVHRVCVDGLRSARSSIRPNSASTGPAAVSPDRPGVSERVFAGRLLGASFFRSRGFEGPQQPALHLPHPCLPAGHTNTRYSFPTFNRIRTFVHELLDSQIGELMVEPLRSTDVNERSRRSLEPDDLGI